MMKRKPQNGTQKAKIIVEDPSLDANTSLCKLFKFIITKLIVRSQ